MTHPLVKTRMFCLLLIIQYNLVLCLTKFVYTLLQPMSKSQKSYLSLKRQMWKTEHLLFGWTLWVLTQIYSKTMVYWNCLSQSIIFYENFYKDNPFLDPTHYLPEMLRLILKENKIPSTSMESTTYKTMELQWAQRQQFWFLCQYFLDIYWNNNSKQNCL